MAAVADPGAVATGRQRSEELHGTLWAEAVAAAETVPAATSWPVLLALNEVFDLHTERIGIGQYSRIPPVIWGSLLLVGAAGMMAVGYQAGLAGPRPSLVAFLLMFAISAVIALIADLDNPQVGLLDADQQSLQDTARLLRESP